MNNRNNFETVNKLFNVLFVSTALFLCLDFGYIKYRSKAVEYIMKTIRLIQITVVSVVMIFYSGILVDFHVLTIFWYISINLQYLTCTIILEFSDEKNSFFTFQNSLREIDEDLNTPKCVYRVEFLMIVTYVVYLSCKLIVVFFYCTFYKIYCNIPVVYIFFFYCPIIAADIVFIVFVYLFYSVYCRMKTLTRMASHCARDVTPCIDVYQKLADVTDQARANFCSIFCVVLMFYVSDTMISVFYPLTESKPETSVLDYMSANITVVPNLCCMFAPACAASKLAHQVDELKMMLLERLRADRDKEHSVSLQKFIRYIEACPFKYTVGKVLPLDWSLLVTVLNIMITYIIVLLQVTVY